MANSSPNSAKLGPNTGPKQPLRHEFAFELDQSQPKSRGAHLIPMGPRSIGNCNNHRTLKPSLNYETFLVGEFSSRKIIEKPSSLSLPSKLSISSIP